MISLCNYAGDGVTRRVPYQSPRKHQLFEIIGKYLQKTRPFTAKDRPKAARNRQFPPAARPPYLQ
jgi:hypothetical protein